jgi:hypothetical protein
LALFACVPKPSTDRADSIHVAPPAPCYEYAAFTAELAGDFGSPVEVDAPRRYAWATKDGIVQAEDPFDLFPGIVQEAFDHNSTEILVMNHLASKGWTLVDYELATALSVRRDLHSMHRYVFRRICRDDAPSSQKASERTREARESLEAKSEQD